MKFLKKNMKNKTTDMFIAHIIYADDKPNKNVEPKNRKDFQLMQLREIVGGHIEICETIYKNIIMVIDEEGKLKQKPINALATTLYKYGKKDPIVGTALLCNKNQIK